MIKWPHVLLSAHATCLNEQQIKMDIKIIETKMLSHLKISSVSQESMYIIKLVLKKNKDFYNNIFGPFHDILLCQGGREGMGRDKLK
jgi:hypothetical protein